MFLACRHGIPLRAEDEGENMKRNLIILNPCSGKKRANRYLTDIVDLFTKEGYMSTVLTTTARGDGTLYAAQYAGDFDLITCIGGDGTFNEVVSGLLENDKKVPIGYIPAGSTNDFASSLGLSSDIMKAAQDIVKGEAISLDIGSFTWPLSELLLRLLTVLRRALRICWGIWHIYWRELPASHP